MPDTVTKSWKKEFTIIGAVILLMLPLLGMSVKTYLTLTIAGLAMGMLLFLVASGVSIIFGLMDVLNFAHGALFAWGAYVGFSVFKLFGIGSRPNPPFRTSPSLWSPFLRQWRRLPFSGSYWKESLFAVFTGIIYFRF
jgi:branched-subunit amino acid ABC-type transport system permease component